MSRNLLPENQIHPEALKTVTQYHAEVVTEVIQAVAKNKIVVVGMAQNPFVKKARKALDKADKSYTFLSYGSYFSKWKPRLAIKMWSGWPTFPQVFIDGKLVGGYDDLVKFLAK